MYYYYYGPNRIGLVIDETIQPGAVAPPPPQLPAPTPTSPTPTMSSPRPPYARPIPPLARPYPSPPPPPPPPPPRPVGRVRHLGTSLPPGVRWIRVRGSAHQGRVFPAPMFASLNDPRQRAVSQIPPGAIVQAFVDEMINATGYLPGHGSVVASAAEGKFFGQPAFGGGSVSGCFMRASYLAPDGSTHSGWMNTQDLDTQRTC